MSLSIATWNINSVRLRLDQVVRFLNDYRPDLLCLQEIKCQNEQFPLEAFAALGYPHAVVHGQKGYHGVATISRHPIKPVSQRDLADLGHSRHTAVALKLKGLRGGPLLVHNFYVPSGGDEPNPDRNLKFRQKLDYLEAMAAWHGEKTGDDLGRNMVMLGDLNIAPREHDVWSHREMLGVVSHTPVETAALDAVLNSRDWHDLMRQHIPEPEKLFTWWSYRSRDWRLSNRGRRLDHVWASESIAAKSSGIAVIDAARDWDRPSDHVPVIANFDLSP